MSTGLGADFEKPATVPGALHADPASGSTPITMGRHGSRRHDPRHGGLARFYNLELDYHLERT
jgi:hypothetical protein